MPLLQRKHTDRVADLGAIAGDLVVRAQFNGETALAVKRYAELIREKMFVLWNASIDFAEDRFGHCGFSLLVEDAQSEVNIGLLGFLVTGETDGGKLQVEGIAHDGDGGHGSASLNIGK